jgi:hypothetical protein
MHITMSRGEGCSRAETATLGDFGTPFLDESHLCMTVAGMLTPQTLTTLHEGVIWSARQHTGHSLYLLAVIHYLRSKYIHFARRGHRVTASGMKRDTPCDCL